MIKEGMQGKLGQKESSTAGRIDLDKKAEAVKGVLLAFGKTIKLGSGGNVGFGRDGWSVGQVGNVGFGRDGWSVGQVGNVGFGRDGWSVDQVGNVGRGRLGIGGKGGNVSFEKFGSEVRGGNCRRWRAD
ncbi:collagen alpha-5(IV) chain [Salix suchowensis]|nr:collagen alpha-5(IV) chain [Salix suchowensis]